MVETRNFDRKLGTEKGSDRCLRTQQGTIRKLKRQIPTWAFVQIPAGLLERRPFKLIAYGLFRVLTLGIPWLFDQGRTQSGSGGMGHERQGSQASGKRDRGMKGGVEVSGLVRDGG